MSEPHRVAVEAPDAHHTRPGLLATFWIWFRRDVVLRRLSLLLSAGCLVFIFGYLIVHVIMLAPIFLLAVLAFVYGVSGRRPGAS